MAHETKTWRCGKYELKFDRPRIMGVLNVTPDSFSDGDESNLDVDAAVARGVAMLDAGADIIDVGGESTRPGFTPVTPDEEAKRVLPVIRALAQRGAIVSVDTRHVEVAKAAVRVGASIINDVTGFTDPKMVEFVKSSKCGVVIAHAGELAEPAARAHKEVQLDTSAAAFVAEKARAAAAAAAAEAAAAAAPKKRSRAAGCHAPGGRLGAAPAAVRRHPERLCRRGGEGGRKGAGRRLHRGARRARGRACPPRPRPPKTTSSPPLWPVQRATRRPT